MDNIEFFTKVLMSDKPLSRIDHKICKALIRSMSAAELCQLQEMPIDDWYINKCIEERLIGEVAQQEHTHNKSWRTYLQNIKNHKIGTVEHSRKKLREAFSVLDWRTQRQILWFFLSESTKTDRLWALKIIENAWHLIGDCNIREKTKWTEKIMEVWEKYHEWPSAIIIVKNFQYSTVEANEDLLTHDLGYKYVALRLGEHPDYVVHRDKMTDLDYLYVMAKLGRKVDAITAEAILSETLLGLYDSRQYTFLHEEPLSLLCDSNIGLAIWSLGCLGHSALIRDFYRKDRQLQQIAQATELSIYDRWDKMCDNIPNVFPLLRNHNQQILELLMEDNPALRLLVDKLQLQLK